MSNIKKSKLFPFPVDEEVALRKLFEGVLEETSLGEISDVLISNPDDQDILQFNESLMVWENVPLPSLPIGNLDDIGDVTITTVADGEVLTWDSATSRWVNQAPTGGGGTPAGSGTEIQYRNGSSFGAIAGTAWDGTKLTLPASIQIGASSGAGARTIVGFDELDIQYDHPTDAGSYARLEMGRTGSTQTGWRFEAVGDTGGDTATLVFTSDSTTPEFNGNGLWHAGNFDPSTKQNQSANLDGWSAIATSTKQDTLVSGTNIRTVNGNTLLGSSDLVIATGATTLNGLTDVTITSVTDGQVLTYDSGTNQWVNETPSGGGGLTNWTEAVNTSAPNATVPVVQLLATNAATNVDVALSTKGTGALLAQIPDNTATGGNKRGGNAVDFQVSRAAATQVALGQRSFIGGGVNNTTTSNGTNSAVISGTGGLVSNSNAVVCGGNGCQATATQSFVGAGLSNQATASDSGVICGNSNNASGSRSFIGGGLGNLATGEASWIPGGARADTRSLYGAYAWSGARRSQTGDNQCIGLTVQGTTSGNTPTILTANLGGAGSTNVMVLPNNSCWDGQVWVTGRSSAGDVIRRVIDVVGTRGASAATTAVLDQNPTRSFTSPALVGADAVIVANTTRGSIEAQATGLAGVTIDWFAHFVAGNQIVR